MNRTEEYQAKKAASAADKKKIAKVRDFVETSYLNLALPFVQDETQHWPSWLTNPNGKWVAPFPVSNLARNEAGVPADSRWIELRPDGLPLYRIEFENSRMPIDDDYEYGSMTLYVDGEEVLGMFVRRNRQKEWDCWHFSVVQALKIGAWIEGFVGFYNQLRNIREKKS